MARIVDFNINHNKHLPCNTNTCNVVINNAKSNDNTVPHYPEQVVYNPDALYPDPNASAFKSVSPGIAPQVMTRDVNITETSINMEELYKLLAITFSNILKDNNAKLIANIIDNSGKIIVEATSLVKIIALICNMPESDIHIEYISSKEGGCTACTKINPIKRIENIKIGYVDFKLGYNDKYNILTDMFNISMKKCIIPSGIVYGH